MNPDRMGFYSYKQGMNKIVGDDRQGIELGNHEQIKLTQLHPFHCQLKKTIQLAHQLLAYNTPNCLLQKSIYTKTLSLITPRELLSSTPMVGETKTEVGKFLIGAKVYKIN